MASYSTFDKCYRFLLDVMYSGFFLILLFTIFLNDSPPIFSYIGIAFLFGMILYVIFSKLGSQATKGLLSIVIGLLTGWFFYQLSIPIFFSSLFVTYLYWKINRYYHNNFTLNISLTFTISSLVALITIATCFTTGSNIDHAIELYFFQLLLYFTGNFFSKWFEANRHGKVNKNILGMYVLIVAITILSAGFFTVFLPWMKRAFQIFLLVVVSPLSFLFSPINSFLKDLLGFSSDSDENNSTIENPISYEEEKKPFTDITKTVEITDSFISTIWIIGLILSIVVFIIIIKKGKINRVKKDEMKPHTYSVISKGTTEFPNMNSLFRRKFQTKSLPLIRKEMMLLEKYAKKLKVGRISSETLDQWFSRIGISNNQVIKVYERMRYGDVPITKEESDSFLNHIKEIKNEIKQMYKKKIKNN